MTRNDAPLSVALFATNDPRNYSGGRYLSLMMAYALAHAGCRVTVYTDHVPAFDADLSHLAPGAVRFVVTRDFREGLGVEPQDWVVLIPTGIFLPDFYEAVTRYAATAGARLALVNFESANWFNTTSPHPRDARLWDGWRRSCLDGALVLSIARAGLDAAREFYVSPHAEIRQDVWQPPINSPLAEQFDGTPRRNLVVGFVRPSDPHKGGRDLLALPPGLLAGHELALVAGRDIDPAYLAAVQQHFAGAAGTRISVHTRISDAAKLQMLSEARLLLFPSYFEGYGYPPIEALYCGTPVACYDLPVLRETIGTVAHFAPAGDNEAFAAAAAMALATPSDPAALRRAVHRYAHFPSRADALVDLLVRHADAVPVRRPAAFLCSMGPVAGTKPRTPGPLDMPPLPAFAFHVIDAHTLADGQVAVTALASTVQQPDLVAAAIDGAALPAFMSAADIQVPVGATSRVHLVLPAGLSPEAEVSVLLHAGGDIIAAEPLRLHSAPPAVSDAAPSAGVLSMQRIGDSIYLHAWALADQEVDSVAVALDDASWHTAAVTELRPELAADHPGRTGYRAGFTLQLPVADLPPEGLDLMLVGGGRTLGLLRGWLRADARPVAVRRGRRLAAEAPTIRLAELSNSHWRRGISLFGDARAPSVLTTYDRAAESLPVGTRLRFASGTVACVVQVQKKQPLWNVFVDRPLSPFADGFPGTVEVLDTPRPPGDGLLQFAPDREDDAEWLNGVRVAPDEHHRLVVRLRPDSPAAAALEAGAVLHFAHAGVRTVLAVDEFPEVLEVHLDAVVGPIRDGAPQSVRLTSLPHHDDGLLFVQPSPEHPHGVQRAGELRSRAFFAADSSAATLMPGASLRFAGAGVLVVESVDIGESGVEVVVAGALDALVDGTPHAVHRLGSRPEAAAVRKPSRYPVPRFAAPDPFHLQLADRCAPARVTRATPGGTHQGARPRVLFLTLVPPVPANQGNRVVTRNLIAHLVDLGYDVDCVMQGWVDIPGFIDEFGERVRLYHCASPNWGESAEVKARTAAQRALVPTLGPMHAALGEALGNYHPYFIARDEVVDRARTLLQTRRYDSIVCNYLHMARVVKELEDEFALPHSCIVTHDALSNLTRHMGQTLLDTTYRACTPAVERDALNAVSGGVVVAISSDEQRYFRDIGVELPIVLCEYDAAGELASHVVDAGAFAAHTLIYSASRNPLNLAGLGWFLDECWPGVLDAAPEARLIISGPICDALPSHLPGVELAGNVERSTLLSLMRTASIAINPCVVGTGLKIKTVEAACIGLPAVCLPAAVDGLQSVAGRFAITASDPAGFTAACITLLTDEARWRALHEGGLAVAHERFAHATVYRELDAAMGWTLQPGVAVDEAEPALPGSGAGGLGGAADLASAFAAPGALQGEPALKVALAQAAAATGEFEAAHRLAESAVASEPGNARFAAVAARLAIDAGMPWLGALHAATLVAGPNGVLADGYALMGEALLAMERHDTAADALLQAAAIDPGNPDVARLLVQAFQHLGHHQRHAWALRRITPPLMLGETRRTVADADGVAHLVTGWSQPESWCVWTDGEVAVLDLTLAEVVDGDLAVTLVCHGFTVPEHPHRKVSASVGSTTLARFVLSHGDPECSLSITLPSALLEDGHRLRLTLDIEEPISPAELQISPDPRRLGIALHSVSVDRAPAAS